MNTHAWQAAISEHRRILNAYLAKVEALSPADWQAPMPGRAWTPADETLHLIKSYELPLGDAGMRLRVSPIKAWLLRNLYLRYLLMRGTFHQGARAPSEVRPDPAEAQGIPREQMIARLRETAAAAERALQQAAIERPDYRMVHAYFGSMAPLLGMRLLTAHTRHHARLSKSLLD